MGGVGCSGNGGKWRGGSVGCGVVCGTPTGAGSCEKIGGMEVCCTGGVAGCGGGYIGCAGMPALYDGGAGTLADALAGALSGAPQLSQNASPGIADVPHCGHTTPAEGGGMVAAETGGGTAG